MQSSQHILVIRFSAMGDVAMTVPVVKNVLQQNPQLRITFISPAFLQPLFSGIERCDFYPVDLKNKHKGISGLYTLYKELRTIGTFDLIIDLHNVLRSQILRSFFKISGHSVFVLDKGREAKRELTRKKNKKLRQLTTMHERYADVFRKGGIKVSLHDNNSLQQKDELKDTHLKKLFYSKTKYVGIAPFAQYKEKMYELEQMKLIVTELSKREDVSIFLFGGGKTEIDILQQWEKELPSLYCVAGKYSFKDELSIISNLDAMVSMDSANMHLASLYNVPVVSIWGATHHYAGFYGWQQKEQNIVAVELYCRPCSVFGNATCYRGDHACMKMITPDMIINKLTGIF